MAMLAQALADGVPEGVTPVEVAAPADWEAEISGAEITGAETVSVEISKTEIEISKIETEISKTEISKTETSSDAPPLPRPSTAPIVQSPDAAPSAPPAAVPSVAPPAGVLLEAAASAELTVGSVADAFEYVSNESQVGLQAPSDEKDGAPTFINQLTTRISGLFTPDDKSHVSVRV